MLEGGVLAHRPYLIVGPAGTGKSTLALQFLCEGVRRGERCLLVTIEEPPNELRVNHRGLGDEFDRVDVFDAIPDIMRYERVPFKDISAVRQSMPFGRVPMVIRRTPELTGVEVTITALEQMLRSEVARRGYTRVVIDSLTALQYFCMKGFNEVAGAQTFLRFLSDLRVTTFLTVESPLEDVDTAERMLARGEIRLFRWELDNGTVYAVGVEKFRGSSHDVRLHPYRIGPSGLDITLDRTISRDTRLLVEPEPIVALPVEPTVSPLDPLVDEIADLVAVGADVGPIRHEVEEAVAAARKGDRDVATAHLVVASARSLSAAQEYRTGSRTGSAPLSPASAAAMHRIVQRSDSARVGVAPTALPPSPALEVQLDRLLGWMPRPTTPAPPMEVRSEAAPVIAPPPPVVPLAPSVAPERDATRMEPQEAPTPSESVAPVPVLPAALPSATEAPNTPVPTPPPPAAAPTPGPEPASPVASTPAVAAAVATNRGRTGGAVPSRTWTPKEPPTAPSPIANTARAKPTPRSPPAPTSIPPSEPGSTAGERPLPPPLPIMGTPEPRPPAPTAIPTTSAPSTPAVSRPPPTPEPAPPPTAITAPTPVPEAVTSPSAPEPPVPAAVPRPNKAPAKRRRKSPSKTPKAGPTGTDSVPAEPTPVADAAVTVLEAPAPIPPAAVEPAIPPTKRRAPRKRKAAVVPPSDDVSGVPAVGAATASPVAAEPPTSPSEPTSAPPEAP